MSNLSGHLNKRDDAARMELHDFAGDLLECLRQLQTDGTLAARTAERFAQTTDVWPDQCDRVARQLEPVGLSLQQLGKLIENSRTIPLPVLTLRFELVVKVGYLHQQLQRLQIQARDTRTTCRSTARSAVALRQDLQRKLVTIIQEIDDLRHEFFMLLDRARFRELAM